MFMVSTDVKSLISTLGLIQAGVGLVGGLMWLCLKNRKFVRQVPDQQA